MHFAKLAAVLTIPLLAVAEPTTTTTCTSTLTQTVTITLSHVRTVTSTSGNGTMGYLPTAPGGTTVPVTTTSTPAPSISPISKSGGSVLGVANVAAAAVAGIVIAALI